MHTVTDGSGDVIEETCAGGSCHGSPIGVRKGWKWQL